MKRFQNILLGGWVGLIVLFTLFNLGLVWAESPVEFFWIEFKFPWLFWLCLGAIVLPLLFRILSGSEARQAAKTARKEIADLKARAFDQKGDDAEQLAESIQNRLESTIETAVAAGIAVAAASGPAPQTDPEPEPENGDS